LGAEGIMCPKVMNVEAAKKVINGLRYPPEGSRGVAKMVRATGFGQNFAEYYRDSKENILGVVQIETLEALDHLDEIAAIDGVDVLFVGPADLSMEMGIFNQFDHPRFKAALKATIEAAKKAGKATGILIFNSDDFKTYQEMGIQLIACGADATFVADGARNMANKLNFIRATHSG
jgi:4-hydroxy-2-oxoheptanedioate aldolase